MATKSQRAIQKTQTGTYGSQGEKLNWTYYDTEIINPAVTNVRMFQTPMSGTKHRGLTNMILGGQIPNGKKFVVRALKCFWISYPTAGATTKVTTVNLEQWFDQLANTTLQIKIDNKDVVFESTLIELFGMATAVAFNPALTANLPFPEPRFHGIFPLPFKITLASLTSFYVEVQHNTAIPAACTGDHFKFGLNGGLLRVG